MPVRTSGQMMPDGLCDHCAGYCDNMEVDTASECQGHGNNGCLTSYTLQISHWRNVASVCVLCV